MDPTDRPQFIEHVHKRQLPRHSHPTFRFSSLNNNAYLQLAAYR